MRNSQYERHLTTGAKRSNFTQTTIAAQEENVHAAPNSVWQNICHRSGRRPGEDNAICQILDTMPMRKQECDIQNGGSRKHLGESTLQSGRGCGKCRWLSDRAKMIIGGLQLHEFSFGVRKMSHEREGLAGSGVTGRRMSISWQNKKMTKYQKLFFCLANEIYWIVP